MEILKNKPFSRWQKDAKLSDAKLISSINEIEQGLVDADLGGHIFKKRVPLGNRGKNKGARTILAFKAGDRAIFMYGFAKKDTDNITKDELKALKELAKQYFGLTNKGLAKAIKDGILIEVENNG